VDALVALFTEDVFVSMPPIPLEYRGRDAAGRLFASIFGSGRRVHLIPTRPTANRRSGPTCAPRRASVLFVLTLSGDRIRAFTRFDSSVFPSFGLAVSLPSRKPRR
jgi:hypothetical protein